MNCKTFNHHVQGVDEVPTQHREGHKALPIFFMRGAPIGPANPPCPTENNETIVRRTSAS